MKLKNFWDLFEFFSLSQMVREFLPGPGNSGGGAAAVLWMDWFDQKHVFIDSHGCSSRENEIFAFGP